MALALGYCPMMCRIFHSIDPLAQRDDDSEVASRSGARIVTDFELRYSWRPVYYWQSGESTLPRYRLCRLHATALRRLGYYCGPD